MLNRIMGVLRLDAATFNEIEADEGATMQAGIIVAIVAIISGVGLGAVSENFVLGVVYGVVNALIGWGVWAAVTYFVGTFLFGGKATFSEMLRMTGFAQTPLLLSFIPCVGIFAALWSLATGFIAIREGLDIDNIKSILTAVIAWVVVVVVGAVLATVLGVSAGIVGSVGGMLGAP